MKFDKIIWWFLSLIAVVKIPRDKKKMYSKNLIFIIETLGTYNIRGFPLKSILTKVSLVSP